MFVEVNHMGFYNELDKELYCKWHGCVPEATAEINNNVVNLHVKCSRCGFTFLKTSNPILTQEMKEHGIKIHACK